MPVVLFRRNGDPYTLKSGDRVSLHVCRNGYDQRITLSFETGLRERTLWGLGECLYFNAHSTRDSWGHLLELPISTEEHTVRRLVESFAGLKIGEMREAPFNNGSNGSGFNWTCLLKE